ncbi:MAG: HD domain-containing phosphohydrolase [Pirellulaceae bacterium]
MANTKILCVDDDQKILNGIVRQQGEDFDITLALGPHQALRIIAEEGSFAVVLSDMRMPEMNGVQLLARVREGSPNTVRMILTGYAELQTTIEAVNEGHIFRFLSKPCSEEDLASAFKSGLRQHSLVEAEKELVEGTLYGSVKVLSDVLSLVNPLAFGQSSRVRTTVDGILKRMNIADQWQLEIAAMLSSLGCVTLPSDLLKKKLDGVKLSTEEKNIFDAHPAIAGELLRSIPRLEHVAEIIAHQNAASSEKAIANKQTPIESRILKIAIEFDLRELNAESSLHALRELKADRDQYGEDLFDALSDYVKTERNLEFTSLMVHEIRQGMVLAEDIKNAGGTLLMSKGQEISSSAIRLLENFSNNKSIREPINVVVSNKADFAPAA